MTRTRSYFGLVPILMSAALGCGGNTPATTDPGQGGSDDVAEAQQGSGEHAMVGEEEDESTGDLAAHHRHHHHGGFAGFIAMSLNQINATPEQQGTIEKIRDAMWATMQPAHDAEKNLLLAVADDVAANQFDPAKLDAATAQLATASGALRDAIAESLDQLHATLTPQQRAALVDKMQAHFEVWHHTNAPADEHDEDGGQLGHLGKELNLTPDQIAKARAAFEQSMSSVPKFDRSEADAHIKAFGEAFAADTFEAKSLPATEVNAHMATWGTTRMVKLYEALTPQLTPDQRTKLADNIRHHANYQHNEG